MNGLSTNNVIVNFAAFGVPATSISSVTVQGCYSFSYGGTYYYNAPVTLGKYNYPAITNGYAVFTNLLCGVPYTITLSGYSTYATNFTIPATTQPDGNGNISAYTWVGSYSATSRTFTWDNPSVTNYLIGVGATNVVTTNGTSIIIGQTLYLNADTNGAAAAVQAGVVSGSIVAAQATHATNADLATQATSAYVATFAASASSVAATGVAPGNLGASVIVTSPLNGALVTGTLTNNTSGNAAGATNLYGNIPTTQVTGLGTAAYSNAAAFQSPLTYQPATNGAAIANSQLPATLTNNTTGSSANTTNLVGASVTLTGTNGASTASFTTAGVLKLNLQTNSTSSGGVTNQSDLSLLQSGNLLQSSMANVPPPIGGASKTLLSVSGSGEIEKIYIVVGGGGAGDSGWNDRLQIYADGEAIPSVDCDLGTLFLTGLNGHGANQFVWTKHIKSAASGTANVAITSFFPVPFTNGVRVVLLAPSAGSASGGNLFSQISYHTNAPQYPNLRLKSVCLPYINYQSYGSNQIAYFFTQTNMCGWLAYQGVNASSPLSSPSYLERQWFYGVDGESLTPDSYGAIFTAYATSGGEDLFDLGWYFLGLTTGSDPNAAFYASGGNTTAGYDFMAAGGIYFTNQLNCGWSLKDGLVSNTISAPFNIGYSYLFYQNIAVPYAPAQASLSGTWATNSITLTITNPINQGSQPIQNFYITYTNATTNAIYVVGAGTNTLIASGFQGTNGASFWWNIVASNRIGAGWVSPRVSFASYVPPSPATNMLGLLAWYFNGNLNDSSGNSRNATSGSNPYTFGADGIANHAITGNNPTAMTTNLTGLISYPYTVTGWIKSPSQSCIAAIYNNAHGNFTDDYIYVQANGTVQCVTGGTGASSAYLVTDSNWHFFCAEFISTTSRQIYIDGTLSGSSTASAAQPSGINTLSALSYGNGNAQGTYLDDLRIFSRALSTNEIVNLYNYGAQ